MTDFEALLRRLVDSGVDFILVGGYAATAHGSPRVTVDLDVAYARDPANLARLAGALADLDPYLRGAPPGLPFRLDAEALRRGLNFTLTTRLGDLDLLGEVTGAGSYAALLARSIEIEPFGLKVRCLDLETLIATKRAAGRPKDLEAIAELEALRDERGGSGRS
ncbi:MAG: hypothetical protein AB7O37_15085 [Vicinamibacteria bacterium]